jgi:hypothetical protein
VLDDGAIVSGTSVESYRSWSVWIERSTNHGRTWTKFGPIVVDPRYAGGGTPKDTSSPAEWDLTEGIIQPSIVRLGGKRLRLYARSTSRTGKICIADSNDLGITWTQARPIDLPNPNSGIDADTLPDGRVVLVYNHTTKGRTPLNLAISKDGEQFQMFQTLESEPGEYSYPSMIVGGRGSAHHIHLEPPPDPVRAGTAGSGAAIIRSLEAATFIARLEMAASARTGPRLRSPCFIKIADFVR